MQKHKIHINLYKIEYNNRGNLKFVRACHENSILSVTKKTYDDLDFVKFVPIIDNLPLGQPKVVVAFTKSDVYIFRETKNIIKHDSRNNRKAIKKTRKKIEKNKFKQQLEKHEQAIKRSLMLSKTVEPKEELTSLPVLKNEDKDYRFWIP